MIELENLWTCEEGEVKERIVKLVNQFMHLGWDQMHVNHLIAQEIEEWEGCAVETYALFPRRFPRRIKGSW